MDVRPFDWHDLPTLHRYRHQSVFLNSYLLLTRGQLALPGALLSSLMPSLGVFTLVGNGDSDKNQPVFGQAVHRAGEELTYMTFLAPERDLDLPTLNGVVDGLIKAAGERGSLHLVADVDESCEAFSLLREASFATYTRQRIWRFATIQPSDNNSGVWRVADNKHAIAIRSLYHSLVPGLVQQVELYSDDKPKGMIYTQDDQVLAYVEFKYGIRGIWIQPFVHPDTPALAKQFGELINQLPYRRSRPVYVCVRSYQSWLEGALDELGGEPGPTQAVLVKHLAITKKALPLVEIATIEGSQPEVTASIRHMKMHNSSDYSAEG